jgi:hypothetical protein
MKVEKIGAVIVAIIKALKFKCTCCKSSCNTMDEAPKEPDELSEVKEV